MEDSKSFLCRTCLKESIKVYPLTHSFNGHEDIDFALMLMSCTSVCIKPNDTLPQSICENCITSLIRSYIFKQQCEKSDIFLRTHECLETLNKDAFRKSNDSMKDNQHLLSIIDQQIEHNLCDKDNSTQNSSLQNRKMDHNIKFNKNVAKEGLKKILVVLRRRNKNDEHQNNLAKVHSQENTYNKKKITESKRKSKIYKCKDCDKQFRTHYGFRYHSQIHTGIKKYTCPITSCKKQFLWEPTLKRHMQVHSTEKTYLCNLCGKAYSASDSLRHHIKSHEGKRPYLCVICGKTFIQAVHLKYHARSHSGERPHVCLKCNRSYMTPNQLKKHLNKYCGVGRTPPQKKRIYNISNVK